MRWLRELVDPAKLASSMSQGYRFRRGVLIFLGAIAAYILSSVYYVENKLAVRYASPSIKLPSPPITEPPEVVFVSTLYLTLGFLAVVGVFAITIYFKASERRSLLPLLSSAMHAFIAFLVAAGLLMPLLVSLKPVEVSITYAELEEVKLENAQIVGVLSSNNSLVAATSDVLRSPKLVYNASNQASPLTIQSATARFSNSIVGLGDIYVKHLSWERIEFSGFNYVTEPGQVREPLSAIATISSWLWVVFYVGVACRRIYGVSSGTAAFSALASVMVLLIFGLL
ncbi:MAG: hypothetical protein QXO86_06000 [Nitrososphaerota archaeon]